VKPEKTVAGAISLLHSFTQDQSERRQYQRVELQFPLWWLRDFKDNEAIPGIGIEISGGGLQFILEQKIELQCALAFVLEERRMRANVMIVQSGVCTYKGQEWHRHRAKFVGLMNSDFDFIVAFADAHAPHRSDQAAGSAARLPLARPKSKHSVGVLESYDMLPLRLQEMIVRKLVDLKRMVRPQEIRLALLAAHYGGIQPATDGSVFHRFFIRTRMQSKTGPLVYNTEVLISDNGEDIIVRD
jgi:hypothetical protein